MSNENRTLILVSFITRQLKLDSFIIAAAAFNLYPRLERRSYLQRRERARETLLETRLARASFITYCCIRGDKRVKHIRRRYIIITRAAILHTGAEILSSAATLKSNCISMTVLAKMHTCKPYIPESMCAVQSRLLAGPKEIYLFGRARDHY
jgi:hypothetical protein